MIFKEGAKWKTLSIINYLPFYAWCVKMWKWGITHYSKEFIGAIYITTSVYDIYSQNNSKISYTYEQINSFMLVSRQYIIILVTLVHENKCLKGHHNNYGGKSFLNTTQWRILVSPG